MSKLILKRNTLLIPVELCEYVMRDKYFAPFSLYLALKFYFMDVFVLTTEDLESLREILGYDTIKSIKNNLRRLYKDGFIGLDQVTKRWHVRGLEFICRKYRFQSRTGVFFELSDIKNIRGFCVATVAASIIKSKKRKRWLQGSKKSCPSQSSHTSFLRILSELAIPLSDEMIADSYLARKLKVSNYAVNKWKKLAAKAGYIKVINSRKALNLSSNNRNTWLQGHPEYEPFLRISHGRLYIQLPDRIISNVRFGNRKKKS